MQDTENVSRNPGNGSQTRVRRRMESTLKGFAQTFAVLKLNLISFYCHTFIE